MFLSLFLPFSRQQFVITDVCDSTTLSGLRYNNDGFEVCQGAGNPTTYEFVPICESATFSCDNCNLTCLNGGTCVTASGFSLCLCPQNWGGLSCETRVNDCLLNTVCLTDDIPFTQCALSIPFGETYFQDNCQLPGVNCNPSSCSLTCLNNGTCITQTVQGNTREICQCANGYAGTLCDTMTTPFNMSTLCSAGYNVSALSTLMALAVFALYVISVM